VTNKGLGSGYGTLFSGQQTGWTLGGEYSIPLRQRLAKTRLQGLELQLAKSQALLRVQEVEISHELAAAFREIDRTWLAAEVHTDRLSTAEERLNALKALSKSAPDRVSIDDILRAQRAVADARRDILKSYTEYTLAITGGLLPAHNISLYDHAIQPHPLEYSYFNSNGFDSPASSRRDQLADDQATAPGLLPVHGMTR
jgi:Outer membrane efflux protein